MEESKSKSRIILSETGVEFNEPQVFIIPQTVKVIEGPRLPIPLEKGVWGRFSTTILTFEEYLGFCLDTGREVPSDEGWGYGKRPAINISAIDGCEYCNWLNEKIGELPNDEGKMVKLDFRYIIESDCIRIPNASAKGFRLPFEEEWLMAAADLIDDKTRPKTEADVAAIAWYSGNSNNQTQPVGLLKPNKFGLYDMLGLVYEIAFPLRNS